ncbi:hypothetical protein A4A49_00861 [Nicotiana attenuata]|uniref:Uncharacterized protein n=1 Tax=Nicotiana attenuata TaxID=49451 RepID=A0A1J6IA91_NICAT|nr:hypothetical protein A4A49_00861 [Nicotiana attenuata]
MLNMCKGHLRNDYFLNCDDLLNNCFSVQVVENSKGTDFVAEEEEPKFAMAVEDIKLSSPKNRESNTNEVVKSDI